MDPVEKMLGPDHYNFQPRPIRKKMDKEMNIISLKQFGKKYNQLDESQKNEVYNMMQIKQMGI